MDVVTRWWLAPGKGRDARIQMVVDERIDVKLRPSTDELDESRAGQSPSATVRTDRSAEVAAVPQRTMRGR